MSGLFEPYREFINNSKDQEEEQTIKDKLKNAADAFRVKQPYSSIANSVSDANGEKGKAPIPQKEIEKLTGRRVSFLMVFIKIFSLIKKDLKLILRSRSSGLIIFFGPLLLILLVGLAFNTSTLYSLKVASYTPTENQLSESVLQGLTSEEYTVHPVYSLEQCKSSVRSGESHICVAFSDTFEAGSPESKVSYYVDESRVNIAYTLANSVNQKIRSASAEISEGFTTDIITVLDSTKTTIEENVDSLNTLISINSDASLELDEAQENLKKLDLTFNEDDYNFTGVRETISFYEGKDNKSLSKITNALDDLELEFLLLSERFETLQTQTQAGTTSIVKAQSTVSGAAGTLTNLRDVLTTTSKAITNIKVTDTGVIVEPIKSEIEPLTKDNTHLSFLFPTLLVLVVMFISILLSSTVVMKEKNSKAFFRNFINPTGDFLYLVGTYLTTVLLVGLQLIILLLAALYFKKELLINIWPLLGTLLIVATVFIFLGMAIGYVFRTEETSILGSIAVATTLLLFSNTVLPIESLPSPFREIVNFNPFIIAEGLVKQIMLFSTPLKDLYLSFAYLGVFIIGLFVIAYVGRLISKRRA